MAVIAAVSRGYANDRGTAVSRETLASNRILLFGLGLDRPVDYYIIIPRQGR